VKEFIDSLSTGNCFLREFIQ